MSNSVMKPIPPHAKMVFKGHIFSVWQWDQECFDGSTAIFERLTRSDYAYMIGVLPDQRIMLAEDDQPDRDSVLTPAGGRVEEGESAKDGAGRELLEETGYEAQKSVLWHTYRPNNKIEMTVHAFIGRNIKKVKEPHLDPGERIKPVFFTFDEFLELGQNPDLRDWFLRIKLLEAQIDPIKKDELKQLLYGN